MIMGRLRRSLGQAEDAIDAVHGSLAPSPALNDEWRDEFCTDLVVMRAKLEAIACVLAEPAPRESASIAGNEADPSGA